jgi:hypothetical protein
MFFFNTNPSKYNNFFLSGVAENTEPVLDRTILYHVKEKHISSNCYIRVGTLTEILAQVSKKKLQEIQFFRDVMLYSWVCRPQHSKELST